MICFKQRCGKFRRKVYGLLLAILSSALAAGVTAEEAPPSRSSDQPAAENLDKQLLRELLPELPLEPKLPDGESVDKSVDKDKPVAAPQSRMPFADELDEAVASMREVSRRLDDRNLSDETAKLQAGIVSNIDALIEKLRKLPPPSSSSSQNSDKDQSDSDSKSQGQQPESKQGEQQSSGNQHGADSAAGTAPQPQNGKSGESTEQNLRQAQERSAALARRRALIDEVWGHLPPAMRERLLNVGSEKLLPKYENLIRRYYEALAEPDNAGSKR
ncbi:MAG: hypothetical protein ISQ06_10375 [Planctomycetaceae bacterium]|jgi:hypothetical protein|nr:hypothetical protein [Planctomycetaceae bacterium]